MKKITTTILGLSLMASTALFAHGDKKVNDHTGDHMHEGKLTNHSNTNGMPDSHMKNMNHGSSNMSSNNMQAYHNQMMTDNYMVTLSSKKPLKDGNNHMSIMLEQNGKPVKNADVNIKFSMPSMPGMDFTQHAKIHGNMYNTKINFSMMGEWAYELMFKTSDGHMHTTKGSVNLK